MIRRTTTRNCGPAALAGGLILSLMVAGCSSQQSSTNSSAPSTAAKPPVTVTVDGRDQNVKGPVACVTAAGLVNIAVGEKISGTDLTAYSATMTDANPPEVRSVLLGEVDGQGLSYLRGFYDTTAQATRDGKSYKISGTASSGLGKQTRRFEMDVTCP